MHTREEIASEIIQKLEQHKIKLQEDFLSKGNSIGFFYIDDVLPQKLALEIYNQFPKIEETVQRKNLKEHKYIAYQMNRFHSLLEEVIYAFQDDRVVQMISEICKLTNILPDKSLYAGGLSLMKKANFLNPHLDNSHDKDRNQWRVLNLLYYATPNWELKDGGNLELWQNGLKQRPTTIVSKFNRLVVMATHQESWHSVNKVLADKVRCCVSNYYFSETPLHSSDRFHVTTFRGRPTEKVKDIILQLENTCRSMIRKVFKKGIRENPHQYKK